MTNTLEPTDKEETMSKTDIERGTEKQTAGNPASDVAAEKSASATQTLDDWDGPNDMDNPMNWPARKKYYHTGATAFLGFAVTCGSSLITPSTLEIAQYFDVSEVAAILTLSLFSLGLGLGPIIAAPISETMGRSVVYKVTGPVYLLFILGAGFSTSIGSLLVCRLFAGIMGGPCLAVGAGTNADMFPLHQRAIPSTLYVLMPFLGPALGPVIGGFTASYKDWRWSQWCTIFVGLAACIVVMPMSETYKKVILKRRAKHRSVAPPAATKVKASTQLRFLLLVTLVRPIRMLATEPIVFLFSLYTALGFAIMFSFFAAYPYVFSTVYHFNSWQTGLLFIALGVGVLLAALTAGLIDKLYYLPRHKAAIARGDTRLEPEFRLLIGQIGSFGLPIGLFWFGWSSRAHVHWIVPTLAGIPFAWGNLCVFIASALYMIDTYGPLLGASSLAANGILRYTFGAVFPLFTLAMYSNLGIGWASSVFAFITVAMIPIPFLFYTFGPRIRAKSKMMSS